MPFKPSLVALPVDPTAYPYLGFPLTEIVLEQDNGEGAALPALPTPDSRDKLTESVQGSDVRVNRRKLTDVELDIDYISADKKAEIERLYHDGRSVYLSPNFDSHTEFSVPFQRTEKDFSGRRSFATDRSGTSFKWDEVDKVFRSWDDDTPSIVFRGRWSRYLRSDQGMANKATKPHPNSVSTGWTLAAGSATIDYVEDILSPVLEKRTVTSGKGVTRVHSTTPPPIAAIDHISAATLSTTFDVMGTVCIAWTGLIRVSLTNPAGSVVYKSYDLTGDGTFQLIKLAGENTDSTNQAKITLYFVDNVTTDQLALIGPVYIGSEISTITFPRIPDWVETSHTIEEVVTNDGIITILPELTLSFFAKYIGNHYTAGVEFGSTADGFMLFSTNDWRFGQNGGSVYFNSVDTEFGLSDGDWYHVVFTCSVSSGVNLFINGTAHSSNGTYPYDPINTANQVSIGVIGTYSMEDSGMSHVRCDRRVWSQDEITDHYDTYFKDFGRGIIEPAFGKELVIGGMEWIPRPGDKNDQWLGRITLRELGVEEDFAGIQRQEGTL